MPCPSALEAPEVSRRGGSEGATTLQPHTAATRGCSQVASRWWAHLSLANNLPKQPQEHRVSRRLWGLRQDSREVASVSLEAHCLPPAPTAPPASSSQVLLRSRPRRATGARAAGLPGGCATQAPFQAPVNILCLVLQVPRRAPGPMSLQICTLTPPEPSFALITNMAQSSTPDSEPAWLLS